MRFLSMALLALSLATVGHAQNAIGQTQNLAIAAPPNPAPALVARDPALAAADKLLEQKNWAEARTAYDTARANIANWRLPLVRQAVEAAVHCSLQLKKWDDALALARLYVQKTAGSYEEAVGERFLAGIFLNIPHQGTKRGSIYLRGEWTQGVRVSTWRKDIAAAVAHYERARLLLQRLAQQPPPAQDAAGKALDPAAFKNNLEAERIGVDFDLAGALTRSRQSYYYEYGRGWHWWWWAGGRDDDEDSAATEEADYEEPRWGYRPQRQGPPPGIPIGQDGTPRFMQVPPGYNPEHGAGLRIRFLLSEIQQLDTAPTKDNAARALLRWAMIARTLYGPENMSQWTAGQTRYDSRGRLLPAAANTDVPAKKVWELADDETLTGVGGKLRLVTLPPTESPLALWRAVEQKYPASAASAEARYARGAYYQTRQQFPQAIAAYRSFIADYPKARRVASAKGQIELIEKPAVQLAGGAVHLPGARPQLKFTFRNLNEIAFTARRVDLVKFARDRMEELPKDAWWNYRDISYNFFNLRNDKEEVWKRYLGETAAQWREAVQPEPGHRNSQGVAAAPLTEPGAYVVEANLPGAAAGAEPAGRVLILVTDIAIVHKNMTNNGLIWVVDAVTGKPLPERAVRVYEHWVDYKESTRTPGFLSNVVTTDANGVIEYKCQHPGAQVDAVVAGEDRRMALSYFQNWYESESYSTRSTGARYFVATDRPVYRPGSTVKFRAWVRSTENGAFKLPAGDRHVGLVIYDAKNVAVKSFDAQADEHGGVSGEYQIGEEPPLGVYRIAVNGYGPDGRRNAGGLFRVEEYKKPEFEVAVTPASTQARLGDKVKARITARYYFGAPVAHGTVRYKVFRENYNHVYLRDGQYDWLYGRGYGYYRYAYPWLPWWGVWGCYLDYNYAWWPGYYGYGNYDDNEYRRRSESDTRKAQRELVAESEAALRPDGTYDVIIDTAAAKRDLSDRDHRYTVEAEVRDASRRTITGEGSVIVTRRQFFAFVDTDGGWYRSHSDSAVNIRTLTADNTPVAAKGEVAIYRITYPDGGKVAREEVVRRWSAATDEDGRLAFTFRMPGAGQYRVLFQTRDAFKEEVLGNAVVWVGGEGFTGREFRFNDLEIIADKRTYQEGDVAHLLINTARENAHVLFSDDVESGRLRGYRIIKMQGRSMVIDIPIQARHVPNFFVEATLVQGGEVFTEAQELFVPPVQGLLNIDLKTDKPSYAAGAKGHVRLTATDAAGKPVAGQVVLSAYDKSVTYIQDEFGPGPRVFFHGQRRSHSAVVNSSQRQTFAQMGYVLQPESYLGNEPDGWRGFWDGETDGRLLDRSDRFEGSDRDAMVVRLESSTSPANYAGALGRFKLAYDVASPAGSTFAAGVTGGQMSVFAALAEKGNGAATAERDRESGPALLDPEIRTNFDDTAAWFPALTLDANGVAEADITFPQSLTTWRLRAYALTKATQVGEATAEAVTTKKLLVRLQSPRFFIERDEVVISANVHNYLPKNKKAKVELVIPAGLFSPLANSAGAARDAEGNLHLTVTTDVAANGEKRVDWPLKVTQAGLARITVKALTNEESDGMRLAFPVLVHGVDKTVAQSGSYRVAQTGERTLKLALPQDIDPARTHLQINLSPSLAGVMVDALPYLAGYPYGCVEQTMSRFYPSLLVKDTLKRLGTDLETIGKQRRQMNQGDLDHRFGRNQSPVFDSAELDRMVQAGLMRLYNFQRPDGGWGWWREDDSSPYQTAYVLQGLKAAIDAGVAVDRGVYERGYQYLRQQIEKELSKPVDERRLGALETQAYTAYILSLEPNRLRDEERKWLMELYEKRGELNNYGRALLALAMKNVGKNDEAALLVRNILQFAERDDTNETAWIRTPQNYWWFWWNNDIETNAWVLKALVAVDPKNDLAPRLVKWLLGNRRQGYYWRGTRDTAHVIAAMTDYMRATGEAAPDYNLVVRVDDKIMRELKVTKDNFFTFDNRIELYGLQLPPGPHQVTVTKEGQGALYYSAYLSYFTKEEDVEGAGNEIGIDRQYFKLVPKIESVRVPDAGVAAMLPAGQEIPPAEAGRTEQRDGYTRVPLKTGDAVTSGDLIEVVLNLTAKNVYDYLAFEDMKPAGCEPVELRSGGRYAGGLCANMELRDEKIVFFIGLLEQGQHVLRYKLRAETPGLFHALPTKGFAMYAPEVNAISDEMRLGIKDTK